MSPSRPRPGGKIQPSGELGRTEYESGLRVVTERMPSMRSVTLGVWVDVGSRDERPVLAGSSHFLEHLLFKGTKARTARQIAESFDAIGGDLNAFTAKEYTCYYCRVSDEDVPMAVEAMADMLQHSIIAAKDLEAERQVILEEINMRDDDPGDLIHDVFAETLWGDHPLGRPVLGTRDTITGMKRDQVKRFYDRLYVPNHFVIAAAGNLAHDDLCRLIENRMDTGRKVSGGSRQLRTGGDAPVPVAATDVLHRSTEQAHISMGTNGYSRRDDERFAFGVVNSILGGGMSSRLFQEIREKRGMAYSVYSYHTMYTEAGLFSIYAGTTPSNAKEVVAVARGQMEDLAAGGLTDEELERAKGHVRGSLVLSLEDTSGRMSRIGRGEISHGEIMSVDELIARTESVTKEDAVATAADVFSRPMALAVIGPFRKRDFAGGAAGAGGPEAMAAHGGARR